MIGLLAKWFIPNSGALDAPGVRGAYGTLCGAVGIALNALLFLGKLLAGSLSGSIAVTADAFNNLSDAGSSLITLIGFRMAGRKPDPQHPFGHGRIEYISGFIVALAEYADSKCPTLLKRGEYDGTQQRPATAKVPDGDGRGGA